MPRSRRRAGRRTGLASMFSKRDHCADCEDPGRVYQLSSIICVYCCMLKTARKCRFWKGAKNKSLFYVQDFANEIAVIRINMDYCTKIPYRYNTEYRSCLDSYFGNDAKRPEKNAGKYALRNVSRENFRKNSFNFIQYFWKTRAHSSTVFSSEKKCAILGRDAEKVRAILSENR